LAQQFDEFGAVGLPDRPLADMRIGGAGAIPVEIDPPGTPAAPIVFGEYRPQDLHTIRPGHPLLGPADGELPADVGFDGMRFQAPAYGHDVQGASGTAREIRP